MEILANRRDQDCVENRLLDFITEYLNKIGFSNDEKIFYGEATNFTMAYSVNNVKFYTIKLNEYKKQKDWVVIENKGISMDGEVGDLLLKHFKIKELSNKIINKI